MNKLIIKHGPDANISKLSLEYGELASTATGKLYVGNSSNAAVEVGGGTGSGGSDLAGETTESTTFKTRLGLNQTINGTRITVIGCRATANDSSTAVGCLANASRTNSIAVGCLANASGVNSIAVGYLANASAINSIAVGYLANASGIDSIAVGVGSLASRHGSIAIGRGASAYHKSITIGYMASSSGNVISVCIGQLSRSAKTGDSITIGYNANYVNDTNTVRSNIISIGCNSIVYGTNSTAIGHKARASWDDSTVIGHNAHTSLNYRDGIAATAIGNLASVSGTRGTAVGYNSNAEGDFSVAVGYNTSAAGNYSAVFGPESVSAETDARTIILGVASTSALKCAVNLTVTSDIRDKTDVIEINNSKSLQFISKLNPIQYVRNSRLNYIPNEGDRTEEENEMLLKYGLCSYNKEEHAAGLKKGNRKRVGLSAQEIQQALTEVFDSSDYANIVSDNFHDLETPAPEGIENQLTVGYTELIPFLIGSVKQLMSQNQKLQENYDKLSERLLALENK